MSERLRRFAAAFRMELRLLCMHWSYLALHVAWAGLLWWANKNTWAMTAHVALEGSEGKMALMLVSLIALFVGAASASRSRRTRFAAVEDAFPTGGEVVLGRWLAGVVGLMGALVEPLALAYMSGPPVSWLEALPSFLTEAAIGFGFTTALAWVVTLRVRNTRWVYPLLAGFWMACFGAPLAARSAGKASPYLTVLDFMHGHVDWYRELWGRLSSGRLPLLLDLTYAGMAILLLGLLIGGYRRSRLLRIGLAAGLAVVLGLTLAAGSATLYLKTLADWGRMADEDQAYHQSVTAHLTDPTQRAEDVERYDVTADLSDPAHPTFVAKVMLHNQGQQPLDRFALTLGRDFTVTESSLPVERDSDFLTVKLDRPLRAGETRQFTLRYGGHVWTVQRVYDNLPQPVNFTADQGVRLPPTGGWYPLAGRQWLQPDVDIFSPVADGNRDTYAFHLDVRAPKGWGVVTNLSPAADQGRFDADQATWAMLLASPKLVTEQVGTVTLAAARDDMPVLRPLAADYLKAASYMVRFFPGAKVTGMTLVVLDSATGIPSGTPPSGGQVMSVLDRWTAVGIRRYDNYEEMFLGHPVVHGLWAMTGGGPWTTVVEQQLGMVLWAHYQTNGHAARMRDRIRQPEYNGFAAALCDMYASQGDAGIIQVIDRLRKDAVTVDQMDPAQQAAWVKEAAQRAQ